MRTINLPVELLSLIFLECCSWDIHGVQDALHSCCQLDHSFNGICPQCPADPLSLTSTNGCTALIISQVCHEWRSIALSFPKIWSFISISIPTPPLEDRKKKHLESKKAGTLSNSMGNLTQPESLVDLNCRTLLKMLNFEMEGPIYEVDTELFFDSPQSTTMDLPEDSGSEEPSEELSWSETDLGGNEDDHGASHNDAENDTAANSLSCVSESGDEAREASICSSSDDEALSTYSPILLYLSRSRFEPLSLVLKYPYSDEYIGVLKYKRLRELMLKLMTLLADYCHQWYQADLALNLDEYFGVLLPAARSLPLLCRLKIDLLSGVEISSVPSRRFIPHNWLGPAPQLRSVSLKRFASVRNFGPTSPGYTFLDYTKELTVYQHTPAETFPLLQGIGQAFPPDGNTPIVVRLQEIIESADPYEDRFCRVVTRASSLSISGHIPKRAFRQMLRYLRAPRLESLEILVPLLRSADDTNDSIADHMLLPLPTIRKFFARNGATIASLTLKGFLISGELLLELLKTTPKLMKLVVYERSSSEHLETGVLTLTVEFIESILNGVVTPCLTYFEMKPCWMRTPEKYISSMCSNCEENGKSRLANCVCIGLVRVED
ncbi:hypothetical protein J3R30DRAFT_129108 [Lentinula aciculospora]|uniref:F-box domain-containing protein n=1 Tax=Lentinula aciculospora TaxID=153920 RepID=A0A9W9AUN4_9AGAR|nr:hypothetical protein J3R30DRAFT_129108 [Lentinula aciculospora]